MRSSIWDRSRRPSSGAATEATSTWLGTQAHALRHGQEHAVLRTLAALGARPDLAPDTVDLIHQTAAYFTTRRAAIQYAAFVAAGYPIGSGCVESANNLVVEARLKGAGMHWTRRHVNALLELRAMVANDRWAERWAAIWAGLRTRPRPRRLPAPGAAPGPRTDRAAPVPPIQPRPKLVIDGKPTADHPWRRSSPFRAKP